MSTPDTNYCDSRTPEERANEPETTLTTASLNTPDIEWEKEFDEEFSKGGEWIASNMKSNYIKSFIHSLLTSRDTYWKERVRKEVEGMKDEKLANMEGLMDDESRVFKFKAIIINKVCDTLLDNLK